MNDADVRDDKALELRSAGRSFGAIAKILGFERAHEANDAFNRALRRRPEAERADLRRQEAARLDALADGVRASEDLGPDDVARRLRTLERMRATLLAD